MTEESGCVNPVESKLKSAGWYKKVKREIFADPRTYENHPRFPPKKLAGMYGVDYSTFTRWRKEARDGNQNL